MAALLGRYLRDANSVAEMEKLAKAYLRVSNVEDMMRLDEEVFQVIDQKFRNGDTSLQAVLGAMSAVCAFA